jgi:uncharacterized membrane protein
MNSKTLVNSALASVFALGLVANASQAVAADDKNAEKCYGVVKAGKNDCKTDAHACAGQANKDGQGDSWLFVPKGTCEKIIGGSTQPKA